MASLLSSPRLFFWRQHGWQRCKQKKKMHFAMCKDGGGAEMSANGEGVPRLQLPCQRALAHQTRSLASCSSYSY
eukprot:3835414-Rhodomonas_salina.1